MKICIAQTQPVKGDIEANLVDHINWINQAVNQNADFIIFSELSLTGYEPELAKDLAIDLDDPRLDAFQEVSDSKGIIICVGTPTKAKVGICISLVIFQQNKDRSLYSKQYLHEDEFPYFIPGPSSNGIIEAQERIALAICYETAIPAHSLAAAENKASIYISSVAKTVNGAERTHKRLSGIAKQYGMHVMMCNCVGAFDGNIGGGQSAYWNGQGEFLSKLNMKQNKVLVISI